MPPPVRLKSRLRLWLPFSLRRLDMYYIKFYAKVFVLILVALGALITIGDMFQRFDDFADVARNEGLGLGATSLLFMRYYFSFVSQLVFQYMLPLAMLLAAVITSTAAFAGPRGNNEYIVIRSVGVPVLRAFLPLVLPAVLTAFCFQATRDYYLPALVREYNAIAGRLRNRSSAPTNVTLVGRHGFQSASIGWFAPGGNAYNMILEIRDPAAFQRGQPELGDNDFVAHRAALARLEPAPGGGYQWMPVEKGETQVYTRFSRRVAPWVEPVPTDLTPAMIERLALGDSVSRWSDLLAMERDNSGARFELNWRLADPIACGLLVLWGACFCMGRMLRGKTPSHIQSVGLSMLAAGLFYLLRLSGKTLWESGTLTPVQGVWIPIAAAAVVALAVVWWME